MADRFIPDRLSLWWTTADDQGIDRFLGWLSDLVRDRGQDPILRRRIVSLLRDLPSGAWFEEIRAIWSWVTGQARYQADPTGLEHVTDPIEMDRTIAAWGVVLEDCESLVAYLAALCTAAGIPWAWEAQAKPRARLSHLALRVWDRGSKAWIAADPSAALLVGLPLGSSALPAGGSVVFFSSEGERMKPTSAVGAMFGDATGSAGINMDWGGLVSALLSTGSSVATAIGGQDAEKAAQILTAGAKGAKAIGQAIQKKPAAKPPVSVGTAAAIGAAAIAASLLL